MRRPIAPCACVLALITGAWFGQAYHPLAPSEPLGAVETSAQGATATAWRFYDAIDLLLRTADDSVLRAVIAPDFVDHVDEPGPPSDRDGLVRYLASLRDTFPALRLTPQDVVAQGDRVVARLAPAGVTEGTVLGMPLGGLPPWPAVEIVRIENGRIAERWGSPAGYARSTPLFAETLTVTARSDLLPYLRRVTFAPGPNDSTFNQDGPAIVAVESGEIAVGSDDGGSGATPTANQRLGPGGTLVIPEDMDLELSNRTDAPTVILVLNLALPEQLNTPAGATRLISFDPGVEIQGLAGNGSVVVSHSGGKVTAEIAQITLAPGISLASHPIGGVELVAIEDGTLTLTADGAPFTAWLRDPIWGSVPSGAYAQMPRGSGLSISGVADPEGDVLTSYRNETDQPVTFLILRLASG